MRSATEIALSRRDLLAIVGTLAGSAAMYHAMTALGFASESPYKGRIKLEGDARGTSVLILGAGLAGMTAALELRNAGYAVQVLEFSGRAGGRNWTLRGGDKFEELGGFTQTCGFAPGLYFNPGPWRIPYHHRAVLDYCKRLNVEIQPFVQLNHNALLHSSNAFDGRPQRIRYIRADFQGQIASSSPRSPNRPSSMKPFQPMTRRSFWRRCGHGEHSIKTMLIRPVWRQQVRAAFRGDLAVG
jgi:monoamine oxidase